MGREGNKKRSPELLKLNNYFSDQTVVGMYRGRFRNSSYFKLEIGLLSLFFLLIVTGAALPDIDVSEIAVDQDNINRAVRVLRGWEYDQPGYEPDENKVVGAMDHLFQVFHQISENKIDGKKLIKTVERDFSHLESYLMRELIEAKKNRPKIFKDFSQSNQKFESLFLKLDAYERKLQDQLFQWQERFNDLLGQLSRPMLLSGIGEGECPSNHVDDTTKGKGRELELRKIFEDHFKGESLLSSPFEEGNHIYAVISDKERRLYLATLDGTTHKLLKRELIAQKKEVNWLAASSSFAALADFPYRLFLNPDRELMLLTEEGNVRFNLEGEMIAITPREITDDKNQKTANPAYQKAMDEHFEEGFGHLIPLTGSESDHRRWWAINVLGEVGSKKAIEILTELVNPMDRELSEKIRSDAILALGKIRDPQVLTLIIGRLYHDESHAVRMKAAEALGSGKVRNVNEDDAQDALFRALKEDSSFEVKKQAVESLASFKSEKVSQRLGSFWEAKPKALNSELRLSIIKTLSVIGNAGAGEFLISRANINAQENEEIRNAAIEAFAAIKPAGGESALVAILKSEFNEEDKRREENETLRSSPKAEKRLFKTAILALGEFKITDPQAIPLLVSLLGDKEIYFITRAAAAESLGKIGIYGKGIIDDRAMDVIKRALTRAAKDNFESVSGAAKEALEQLNKK